MNNEKELIAEIVIPQYVRVIVQSNSIRGKCYERDSLGKINKELPLRMCDKDVWKDYKTRVLDTSEYQWKKVGKKEIIVTIDTQEPVYYNTNVGNQRLKIINGQDLHRLTLMPYDRSKIIRAIKDQMIPIVEKLNPIIVRPLIIDGELHDTYIDHLLKKRNGEIDNKDWDIDNRTLFYDKTLPDVLTGCKYKNEANGKMEPTTKVIIPDDHRGYITQSPHSIFCPIEDPNERKLVYKIYHDKRKLGKYYE